MMDILYDGENETSIAIQVYLERKLTHLYEVFPKIAHHLEGIEVFVLDSFEHDRDTMGFYHRVERNIYIIADKHPHTLQSLHTLLHEIGHAVQDKRGKLSRSYDPYGKNSAYWWEEIKAESYALQIFARHFDMVHVLDYARDVLRYFYEEWQKSMKPRVAWNHYQTSWTNSSITNGWVLMNGYNTSVTTWSGSISWTSATSMNAVSQWSITYAC